MEVLGGTSLKAAGQGGDAENHVTLQRGVGRGGCGGRGGKETFKYGGATTHLHHTRKGWGKRLG